MRLVPDYKVQEFVQAYMVVFATLARPGGVRETRHRGVNYVLVHEKYTGDYNKHYDIALVRFDRPLLQQKWDVHKVLRGTIRPICLPPPDYKEEGKQSK